MQNQWTHKQSQLEGATQQRPASIDAGSSFDSVVDAVEVKPSTDRRISALDGVRGVAVLMVMFYHAFSFEMGLDGWVGLPRVISYVTAFGWLGVDLFFVLSGFLITGILLDSKEHPSYFRNFYARRALRILPLYYLTLLIVLIAYRDSVQFVLLSSIFLSNLVTLFGVQMVYGPLWSLAVEEHFYLIWPWIVRFITLRNLSIISGAIVLGEPMVRAIGYNLGAGDTYFYSWFRFDGLAWGALLVLFHRHVKSDRKKLWMLATMTMFTGLVLVIAGFPFGILTRHRLLGSSLQFTAAQLIFVGWIAAALAASNGRGAPILSNLLNWSLLRRCGDLSYCLYLIHLMLLHGWDALMLRTGTDPERYFGRFGAVLARAVVALSLSFLAASLSYRYFEQPILRLKRYFANEQPVRSI